MTKGKIVLVPFPFDDLTADKVRPALCLTDPIGPHRHVVVAFISSQVPNVVTATDIVLDSRHKDFATTGLRVPSMLRLHRLVTLTSALIRRELGHLSPDLQLDVDRKLAALFGLEAS
jgi:mRNA interferase MazF